MSKIIRVFPRKTSMTPDDSLVVIKREPFFDDEADEIHISVAFTYDIPLAEKLEREWRCVAPVKIGGPALNDHGEDFIPGMYVKEGAVITSRGCTNNCWFCDAWKREGREIRELEIKDGWNLLDNNIFACSIQHQEKVYQMLLRQKTKPRFTGGLEAKRFTEYHARWLQKLKPTSAYFAYDTPDDYKPLVETSEILNEYWLFKGHSIGCYVLIGYKKDTLEDAERRLVNTVKLGYFPQAMLLDKGIHYEESEMKKWRRFQREWANKVIVGSKVKKIKQET